MMKFQTHRWQKQKAFTLIELLVVISIISLLIAILLPALAQARASGRKILCGANLRQIVIVQFLYIDDNKNWVMAGYQNNNNIPITQVPWFRQNWLSGYLSAPDGFTGPWSGAGEKTGSIIKCPEVFNYTTVEATALWDYNSSYTYNKRWDADNSNFAFNFQGAFNYQELSRPGDLVALIDHNIISDSGSTSTSILSNPTKHVDPRHLNRANWVAWDGHVETLALEDMPANGAWQKQHIWKK